MYIYWECNDMKKERLWVDMKFCISGLGKVPLRRWYLCMPSNYGGKEDSKKK